MVNSWILNSYMQNLDLCVVLLHHLAAISKNSWAKRLGLASVLTGVLYSHVKYWQRAPSLVLTLSKAEDWCEISQCSQNQTTTPISRCRVFQTEPWRNAGLGPWELEGCIQFIFKNKRSSFKCVWNFSNFYLSQISEFSEKWHRFLFYILFFWTCQHYLHDRSQQVCEKVMGKLCLVKVLVSAEHLW